MGDRAETSPIADIEFSVSAMVCDGCAEKIRTALTAMPGVREVKVRLWRKRVRVQYEPARVQEKQLRDAVGAAGFTAIEA